MSHINASSASGHSNEPDESVSLATITAGIVAAVMFLLISSYVSNDANWTTTTSSAWVSTSLTGHAVASVPAQAEPAQVNKAQHIKAQLQNGESAHFSDALYSADFMNSFTEPT
jgi:hypothetical protein